MIDTHTHLYLEEFDGDRAETMQRALDAGVEHMILPNVDLTTVEPMLALHAQYPHCTSIAMGLHPTEVREDFREALSKTEALLHQHHCVAVGEVGIDLYWDKAFRTEQMQAFDTQLHWATELNLPVIIHCREGLETIYEVFSNFSGTLPQAVFHCFAGTEQDIAKIRQFGDFYFGIGGVVTFKKSNLPQLLPIIGIDRILLETDSPYLAPVPHRGKRNESAYIPRICEFIAATLGITPSQAANATTANAKALFRL